MSERANEAPVLEIENVAKRYRIGTWSRQWVDALRDASLTVSRGEIVALVGESGSGKSTIGRIVCGITLATSGEVTVAAPSTRGEVTVAAPSGQVDGGHPKKKKHRLGAGDAAMVFQDVFGSLNPAHTIRHHLERALKCAYPSMKRAEVDKGVENLLNTVGLAPPEHFLDRLPSDLSGGQRQRVGLARALAPNPEIIVADEPISMLDVSIRVDILNLLDGLRTDKGVSILYITHDLISAGYISDRIVVLYQGYSVETGPAREVLEHPVHPYTQLLKSAIPGVESDVERLPAAVGQSFGVGCPFAPRCPEAMDVCRERMPHETAVGPGRTTRCHARNRSEESEGNAA